METHAFKYWCTSSTFKRKDSY